MFIFITPLKYHLFNKMQIFYCIFFDFFRFFTEFWAKTPFLLTISPFFVTIQFHTIKCGLVPLKVFFMKFFKKIVLFSFFTVFITVTGCNSTVSSVTGSTGEKNLDLSGYVMLGKIETTNSTTAMPEGKLLIGRVNYKSRLVAVDKNKQNQKINLVILTTTRFSVTFCTLFICEKVRKN